MSKIRTVKPELFRHEQLFEAEHHSGFPLRLIYIGLFTVVDAEGRFRWRPRQLKLDILPYDDINFSAALSALAECGFVQRYEWEGESYGVIPTWRKHQHINQREPESVLPDPQRGGARLRPGQPAPVYVTPVTHQDPPIPASVAVHSVEKSTHSPVSDRPDPIMQRPHSVTPAQDTPLSQSPVMSLQDPVAHVQDAAMPMQSPVLQSSASLEMEMEREREREVEVEKEMEGKWNNQHPHRRTVPDPVVLIFEHWQRVMDHPKAVLDKQRRRCIQSALNQGYSVADVCQAVTGCSLTPHNRGHNDRGERYDGLQLILRSADQIDRFMRNAQHPPKRLNKAEQRLQSNVQAAQTWLQQSAVEEKVDGQDG